MLLRFILWTIIIFIAAKIIGSTLRYLRRLATPNQHIKNQRRETYVDEHTDVEDVSYEDVSDKK